MLCNPDQTTPGQRKPLTSCDIGFAQKISVATALLLCIDYSYIYINYMMHCTRLTRVPSFTSCASSRLSSTSKTAYSIFSILPLVSSLRHVSQIQSRLQNVIVKQLYNLAFLPNPLLCPSAVQKYAGLRDKSRQKYLIFWCCPLPPGGYIAISEVNSNAPAINRSIHPSVCACTQEIFTT